jgi:hypothetical protein
MKYRAYEKEAVSDQQEMRVEVRVIAWMTAEEYRRYCAEGLEIKLKEERDGRE